MNKTSSTKSVLTKDQQKFVDLNNELQGLSTNLRHESTFVEHLKKLAKNNEKEYK
jgi:hypothetical protein